MARIAIIGTKGAGKTVFLSVLAMRCRSPESGQPWLEWKTSETQRYVAKAWDALDQQVWPGGSPRDILQQLEWTLHTGDGNSHSLRAFDPAGQDIRDIFEPSEPDLTKNQKELKRILNDADVVLFLVSLRDVIDKAAQLEKDDIEVPLKLAVDFVSQRGVPALLVLTQYDSYKELLEAKASNEDPRYYGVRRYLPQLFGLLSTKKALFSSNVDLHAVAAVAETGPVTDETENTLRKPKKGFRSDGIIEVLDWIKDALDSTTTFSAAFAGEVHNQTNYAKSNIQLTLKKDSKNQLSGYILSADELGGSGKITGAIKGDGINFISCDLVMQVEVDWQGKLNNDIITGTYTIPAKGARPENKGTWQVAVISSVSMDSEEFIDKLQEVNSKILEYELACRDIDGLKKSRLGVLDESSGGGCCCGVILVFLLGVVGSIIGLSDEAQGILIAIGVGLFIIYIIVALIIEGGRYAKYSLLILKRKASKNSFAIEALRQERDTILAEIVKPNIRPE